MKKSLVMALALMLLMLGACGGNAESAQPTALQDGIYLAIAPEFSNTGWKDYVAVTVEGGVITAANWNGIPANGTSDKKTASANGGYDMKSAGAQSDWYEQAALFEQSIIDAQGVPAIVTTDDGKTDAISGVTVSVKQALDLAAQALASTPVTAGAFKDGAYLAAAETPDQNNYTDYVAVYVYNGNIVSVNWDALNAEGATKSSVGDAYGLRAASSMHKEWYEQAAAFNQYAVQNQSVEGLTLNAEGKTDAISGCTINISVPVTLFNTAIENAK